MLAAEVAVDDPESEAVAAGLAVGLLFPIVEAGEEVVAVFAGLPVLAAVVPAAVVGLGVVGFPVAAVDPALVEEGLVVGLPVVEGLLVVGFPVVLAVVAGLVPVDAVDPVVRPG